MVRAECIAEPVYVVFTVHCCSRMSSALPGNTAAAACWECVLYESCFLELFASRVLCLYKKKCCCCRRVIRHPAVPWMLSARVCCAACAYHKRDGVCHMYAACRRSLWGGVALEGPLCYRSGRPFHTICDRTTTSVVNKGASVSTIFGVLTSAMCKWQRPFRVTGSHVKSSQCKINAFFFSFNVPSYACMKLNVWESIYWCCLCTQAQVHWVNLSWCITLSEDNWILNEDTFIIISGCAQKGLTFCLWLF